MRALRLLVALAALAGLAAAISGCGTPAGPPPRRQTISPVGEAQATHEYPSRVPRPSVSRGWPTPIAAVTAFARAYINWNAETVWKKMRALAAQSVGQARAAMQLAAAETSSDYELRQGGIANHGTVEAVAALTGERGRYAVVTREFTTATASAAYQGLQPAWHVTIATVAQPHPGQWVLSGWQPES